MKKLMLLMLVMMLTAGFLVMGSKNADAMNNESAAMLTAGIILLGIPVMNAITRERACAEPAHYRPGPPRHIEKIKVIYVQPEHRRHGRHWVRPYRRGYW